MEYTFTLKYQLADEDRDADALVERLGEAGCDDALVGIGQAGRLALEFTREAADADEAVRSALADVRRAAPSARLALAFGGRLCQRQPRAQADRPPPEVARAGSAASRQQAISGVASGPRCARPASRGTFWQRATAATWARRGAP